MASLVLRPGPRRTDSLTRSDEVTETAVEAIVPWRVRDAALLLALGFGVLALSVAGTQGLYQLQGAPRAVPPQPPAAVAVMAIDLFYLAIVAGVWLLVVRRYRIHWSALGLRYPRRDTLFWLLALSLVLAAGSVGVIGGLSWALAMLGLPAHLVLASDVPARSDPLFFVVIAGSLLLTPIAEELVFRGVLYQALRQRMGVLLGALGSALVFALLHFQPAMIPEFLLLGIVMAAAFERTRSLYPSMLLHAAYNGAIILYTLHVT